MIDAKELVEVLGTENANKLLSLIQSKRRERVSLSEKDRDSALAYLEGQRDKGLLVAFNKALRWYVQFDNVRNDFRAALTTGMSVETQPARPEEALEDLIATGPRQPRRAGPVGSSLFTPR